MDLFLDGLVRAVTLIVQADSELIRVTLMSLRVSGTAILLCLVVGVPLGTAIALNQFRGRGMIMALVNSGMGMPPIVAGLVCDPGGPPAARHRHGRAAAAVEHPAR